MDAVFAMPWCLTHHRSEDHTSLVGPVCAECKQRLYVQPPQGSLRSYWESQPAAYTRNRQPCFVYTLVWDDFRIRTLHAPETEFDPRSANARRDSVPFDDLDADADVFLRPWDRA